MKNTDMGDELDEIARLRGFFAYEHLPPALQELSKPCAELAETMVRKAYSYPSADRVELAHGMRKLLEAKDCLVRAFLSVRRSQP